MDPTSSLDPCRTLVSSGTVHERVGTDPDGTCDPIVSPRGTCSYQLLATSLPTTVKCHSSSARDESYRWEHVRGMLDALLKRAEALGPARDLKAISRDLAPVCSSSALSEIARNSMVVVGAS